MNKEAIIKNFNRSLKNLSLEADEQVASYPNYVVVTDELLLDFDHFYSVIKENYTDEFSNQQIKALDAIRGHIDKIPTEDFLINEIDELKNDDFWKKLRVLSKNAILKLK